MGTITLSLPKEDERLLRRLAFEKYQGKKGSMAKVVSEAIQNIPSEVQRRKAVKELFAMMEKGFPMGKILIKHRSELYDRK